MCYSVMIEQDLKRLSRDFEAALYKEAYAQFREDRIKEPKKFKEVAEDHRIFPGYFAPIICLHQNKPVIRPMRYSAHPPSYMTEASAKSLSTFNARRDSLGKRFWSEAFGYNHGLLVIKAFYEWVAVKDLLKAGVVSLDMVKAEFNRQSEERRQKWIDKGRDPQKLKPTKTEQKDPLDRDIVISFQPDSAEPMVLPVIYSPSHEDHNFGFAVITDDPNPEILAAGHDRMPIILGPEQQKAWLSARGTTQGALCLEQASKHIFFHRIAEAA